jgi:hypothetical protein
MDYSSATLDSETQTTRTYTLSSFERALRRTSGAGHVSGEDFYLLSGYKYTYGITAADIGAEVSFKAVNPGQALGDVDPVTVTISGLSLTALDPRIDGFSPTQGKQGTAITIFGAGFNYATIATVGGVAIDSFVVVDDSTITGAIGAGTVTGKVAVDSALSVTDFVIVNLNLDNKLDVPPANPQQWLKVQFWL